MPFQRQRPLLVLTEDNRTVLETICCSRSEPAHRVERAKMLLGYAEGTTISSIARTMSTNRPKVERCIDKALQLGALAALQDLSRAGRSRQITDEGRTGWWRWRVRNPGTWGILKNGGPPACWPTMFAGTVRRRVIPVC